MFTFKIKIMKDTQAEKQIRENQLSKCKSSLRYFFENYLKINNESIPLRDTDIDYFNMIEVAQNNNAELKRVWMRTKYKWVLIKKP
jgi:hypothetical protein